MRSTALHAHNHLLRRNWSLPFRYDCKQTKYKQLMAKQVGCGTPCLLLSLGVRGSWVHTPAREIVRRVFHPARKLVRFSLLRCPNYNSKVSVGRCTLQTICISLLWGIHVKNYAYSGKLILLNKVTAFLSRPQLPMYHPVTKNSPTPIIFLQYTLETLFCVGFGGNWEQHLKYVIFF